MMNILIMIKTYDLTRINSLWTLNELFMLLISNWNSSSIIILEFVRDVYLVLLFNIFRIRPCQHHKKDRRMHIKMSALYSDQIFVILNIVLLTSKQILKGPFETQLYFKQWTKISTRSKHLNNFSFKFILSLQNSLQLQSI